MKRLTPLVLELGLISKPRESKEGGAYFFVRCFYISNSRTNDVRTL